MRERGIIGTTVFLNFWKDKNLKKLVLYEISIIAVQSSIKIVKRYLYKNCN